MRLIRLLLASLLTAACISSGPEPVRHEAAKQRTSVPDLAETTQSGRLTIALCHQADSPEEVLNWKVPLLRAVHRGTRAVLSAGALRDIRFRVGPCPNDVKFDFCYSKEGRLACREESVTRLLYSAAWASALVTIRAESGLDGLASLSSIGGGDLFELTHASVAGPAAFEELVHAWEVEGNWSAEELRRGRQMVADIQQIEMATTQETPEQLEAPLALYQLISGYLSSFVFGHELSHYFADQCALTKPSALEQTQQFDHLLALQQRGGILCSNDLPLTTELLADRCAFRTVARFEQDARKIGASLSPRVLALGRRLAVDILAWALAYGSGSPGRASYTPDMRFLRASIPGYLHNPLRILGFSQLVREREANAPRQGQDILCEDTARVSVLQLNRALVYCSRADSRDAAIAAIRLGQPKLVEPLGSYFPAGVPEAWRSGQFDEDSTFACRQP